MTTTPEKLNATSFQFEQVLLRMMPSRFSKMPEGKLIAGIFRQAWSDAKDFRARKFFMDDDSTLVMYCTMTGLDASQIRSMFVNHCAAYKQVIA